MFLGGFVAGAVIGYLRFGDSVGWGLALGLGIALVLARLGKAVVRDPTRAQPSRAELRSSAMRLALPFIALGVATFAGIAARSVGVFLIALAVCLVGGFVLRRFVPR